MNSDGMRKHRNKEDFLIMSLNIAMTFYNYNKCSVCERKNAQDA